MSRSILKIMELEGIINQAHEQVMRANTLEKNYSTIDLAMVRIREEATKLKYIDYYNLKELDGNYLLGLDDRDFIMTLYKAVLKRPAGPEDFQIMLGNLCYGNAHRIDIIDSLQESEEAKQFPAIRITGLDEVRKKLNRKRRIKSIPIIGYVLRWCKAMILLPRELAYLEEKTDNFGKQMLTYDIMQKNVQNIGNNVQAINEILHVNHLSLEAKKLEEQRKQYEQKLLDRFYVRYNEELFLESRDLLKERKGIYIDKLNQHFNTDNKKSITVVDLGCGTGEWVEVLQENGYHSIGVDSNQAVVEKDRKLYPHLEITLQESIAFLKSQPSSSMDVITSFHMVEHMEMIEVIELCSEATRVLKPNGLLIIETPNPLNVLISSYYFYLDPTHKRQVPPELLEVYIHAGGLKVLERVFVNPLDFVPYEYNEDDPIKDIVYRFNIEQAYSIVAVKE